MEMALPDPDSIKLESSMDSVRDASDPVPEQTAQGPGLMARAVGYLSRREHSRVELARKLANQGDSNEQIDKILDTLEAKGLLSVERFAQSVVRRKSGRFGAARVLHELKSHGVATAQLDATKLELKDTEYARALAVWQKKFGHLPHGPGDFARQARFLSQRGFAGDAIRQVLKHCESTALEDAGDSAA
jgi:regulatory protein